MKLKSLMAVLLMLLAILAGCSSGGDPVNIDRGTLPEKLSESSGHTLWGMYQFIANPDAGTLDALPLRQSDFHLNGLIFLEPPAGLYIKTSNVAFNGGVLDVDIELINPILGAQFTGFDVSGIFITNGSKSGFVDSGIIMPGVGDTRLLNADGYSRWWNPSEYPVNMGNMFSYQDGLLGTSYGTAQYNCTLNGYKLFCDNLAVNEVSSLDPASEYCKFLGGTGNLRHYKIDLDGGLIFNYAIDANWKKPLGGAPYIIPDSFPEKAWRTEAWNIVVTETENTLWNNGSANGGNLSLSIDVWDHFNSEKNSLLVESPGNFTAVSSPTPSSTSSGSSTYIVNIPDATPSQGSIDLLISVRSEIVTANPFAYFVHTTEVSSLPPFCYHETEPNGMGSPDQFPRTYNPDVDDCFTGRISSTDDEDWYFFLPGQIQQADWETVTVDETPDVGRSPKMDIDSEGRPHIFYSNFTEQFMKHAWYDGTSWVFAPDPGLNCDFVFGFEFDAVDNLHVLYMTSGWSALKYAYHDGVSWSTYVIDSSPGGTDGGMTLDDSGYPHVCWDGSGGHQMYAWKDVSGWHEQEVFSGSGFPAIGSKIDIDSTGYPHIVHCQNYSPLHLYHSWKDASGWHTEILTSPGYNPAIEIDADDNIHVGFFNGSGIMSSKDAMYAVNDGSGWDITDVDDTGDVDSLDLALDSSGLPYLSYHDKVTTSLKYAHFNGSTWDIETPDSEGSPGQGTSIQLLPGNVPCIAHYENVAGDLRFSRPGPGGTYYNYGGMLTVAAVGINVPGGETLTVEMYDANYSLVDSATVDQTLGSASVRLPSGTSYEQPLYIRVTGTSGGIVYDLHPMLNPEYSPSETFFEVEPNNDSGQATIMPLEYDPDSDPTWLTGIFASGDPSDDWFRIDTPVGGTVMAHVSDYDIAAGNEWVSFTLYDSSMVELDTITLLAGDGSHCLSSGSVLPHGSYFVKASTDTWPHRYVIEPIFVQG